MMRRIWELVVGKRCWLVWEAEEAQVAAEVGLETRVEGVGLEEGGPSVCSAEHWRQARFSRTLSTACKPLGEWASS